MTMRNLTNYQRLKALEFLVKNGFTMIHECGRFKLFSPPAYCDGPPHTTYDAKDIFDLADAATGQQLTPEQFDPFQREHQEILDGSHK